MSKAHNGKELQQDYQFPRKKESETFAEMIYNKRTGTYFGRTPKSWGQLLTFYVIFYIILAAMFAICMQGLFASLSDDQPKWKLERSLIGVNPGMGFRPLSEVTERGSVIQFDMEKPDEGRYWVKLIDEFLEPYKNPGKKAKACGFGQKSSPNDICLVDVQAFGPCSPNQDYGYKTGQPCVFLKLNKIYAWEPQIFDLANSDPEDVPQDLRQYISNKTETEKQQIWVSCHGQRAHDEEHLGPISYYPSRGFPAYYYPFLNQKGYLSPLVAVQFQNITRGELVSVECRSYAQNIIYSGSLRDRMGSVTFEFLID